MRTYLTHQCRSLDDDDVWLWGNPELSFHVPVFPSLCLVDSFYFFPTVDGFPSLSSILSSVFTRWFVLNSEAQNSEVKLLSHVQLFATPWTVPTSLLCPWDFPGNSTGVDCHFLLQQIFPTQGLNPVSCIIDRGFTIWATREVSMAGCKNIRDKKKKKRTD